jgi:hypothetical protein
MAAASEPAGNENHLPPPAQISENRRPPRGTKAKTRHDVDAILNLDLDYYAGTSPPPHHASKGGFGLGQQLRESSREL